MKHEAIRKIFLSAISGRYTPAILRVTDHATGESLEAGTGMDADAPLLLASITKMATGACVLRAVDAGRLALSDPVLPFLDDDVRAPLDALPGAAALTVGDLLHQTSGLPGVGVVPGPSAPPHAARPRATAASAASRSLMPR